MKRNSLTWLLGLTLVASLSTESLAAPKQLLIIGDNHDGHKASQQTGQQAGQ